MSEQGELLVRGAPWFVQLQIHRLRAGGVPGAPIIEAGDCDGIEKLLAECRDAGISVTQADIERTLTLRKRTA